MSKEELLDGLRKNWYLIAALAVIGVFVVVRLMADSGTAPAVDTAEAPQLPPARESLEALEQATRPDEQARARRQIEEYQQTIEAEPEAENTPAYLMAMGNLYRQRLSDLESAATCYERIILEFPDAEEARLAFIQLEACYLTLEDTTGLRWVYTKMLEAFPEDSQEHQYAATNLRDL